MEMTLVGIIRRHILDADDPSPEKIADDVLNEIELPQPWRELFWALTRREVQREMRWLVRNSDRPAVIKERLVRLPVGASAVTRPSFLRDTIETFGKWGRVRFGDMTVEMHESRIAGQLKLAAGVKRDIDKHADAINRIKAAGVGCLCDLPEYGGKGVAA